MYLEFLSTCLGYYIPLCFIMTSKDHTRILFMHQASLFSWDTKEKGKYIQISNKQITKSNHTRVECRRLSEAGCTSVSIYNDDLFQQRKCLHWLWTFLEIAHSADGLWLLDGLTVTTMNHFVVCLPPTTILCKLMTLRKRLLLSSASKTFPHRPKFTSLVQHALQHTPVKLKIKSGFYFVRVRKNDVHFLWF